MATLLNVAETEQFLNISRTEDYAIKMLGLSADNLKRACKESSREEVQQLQQTLLPELEDRLKNKCEELAEFLNPDQEKQKIIDSEFSLPSKLRDMKVKLIYDLEQINTRKLKAETEFWYYYKVCI